MSIDNLMHTKHSPSGCFVVVYFGCWPPWMAAFMRTCELNKDWHWMIFTDLDSPPHTPENVIIKPITVKELSRRVSNILNIEYLLPNTRKLCDLKCMYGLIFESELRNYNFFGFCDIDVLWGDISKFLSSKLDTHDIITTRKQAISGHCTLFRNNPTMRSLPLKIPNFINLITNNEYQWLDENGLTKLIMDQPQEFISKVCWDRFLVNFPQVVDRRPSILSPYDFYSWQSGSIYFRGCKSSEIMYLHFMNWKSSMNVKISEQVTKTQHFSIYPYLLTTERLKPLDFRHLRYWLFSLKNPMIHAVAFYRLFKRITSRLMRNP